MFRPHVRALAGALCLLVAAAACSKSSETPAPAKPSEVAAAAPKLGDPAPPPAEKPKPDPPFALVEGERGLRARTEGALDGCTLISPLRSKSAHLIDMDGKVVHTWETRHSPAGGAYFLENGHLLRCAMVEDNPRFHGGGIGGRIEELDWDGKLVWEYELATNERTLHHDISRLPNGNVLAIAWEYHAPEEVFDHGRATNRVHEEGLWSDVVLEIRPTPPSGGEIVWTWRTWDHLVQDVREKGPGFGDPAAFPGRIDINADHRFDPAETEEEVAAREKREQDIGALGYGGGADKAPANGADGAPAKGGDGAPANGADAAPAHGAAKPGAPPKKPDEKYDADWLHTNAIEYSPEHDLIALSVPHLCEVWVIDHSTTAKEAAGSSGGRRGHGGELLYRWGHPRNYGADVEAGRRLRYQHNVTWQAGSKPGEVALLVFDNGPERPGGEYSEVLELALPFDRGRGFAREAGAPFGPSEPAWSYKDPPRFFSPFISGAQRLANGNTLICEGARGRVFEVTRSGEIVWDFYNPLGGEVEPAKQAGKAPSKALFRATRIAKDHPGLASRL